VTAGSRRSHVDGAAAGATIRVAGASDAEAVARLHADSWRRNYRGAYSDEFLDGDVLADRLTVWRARLAQPGEGDRTILAEQRGLAGFAHVVIGEHPAWGSLLDNIHVADAHRGRAIGSRLLGSVAAAVAERPDGGGLYLWVLEQNTAAQAFYERRGAARAERAPVTPPGGVAGRLAGAPARLRYVWPDPSVLL
jgi:ribosomal protein S18 acetylase RimI-like enzyme